MNDDVQPPGQSTRRITTFPPTAIQTLMKILGVVIGLLIASGAMSQNDQSRTDWANVNRYAADNRNLLPASQGKPRIVFMGNSITEGWRSTDSSFFLDNGYIGRGISGQTTSQMLVRFRPDVIALKPSVVVILAGTNDIAENTGPIPLEDVLGNIVSMAQLAQMNNISVVLSSVLPAYDFPWRPGLQPAEKIVRLNAMIASYCAAQNIVYVDYYAHMVDEKKGLDKKFSEDGVHPNPAGYKVMEPLVQDAIKRVLGRH
jgi:lysophospholipase L1-like esterase